MVLLVQGEKMALKALKEDLVQTETLGLQVQLVKRANSVYQDCPVTQEDRVQRDLQVSLDLLEPTARKELGVSLASRVQGDNEVQRVHGALGVLEVLLENQVLRAQQETMVLPAHLVKGDLKDHRAQLVSQDQKAPLVLLERMGFPATLDNVVRLVSKEKLVPRVLEVL